ncbi:unnamed protein product [Coccothraustes coccothraustes]
MEDALKRARGAAVLRPTEPSGGGCISLGRSYDTDRGQVSVRSSCEGELRMFLGEMASLEAILKTQTVRLPKPIKVVELPGDNTVLVIEHWEIRSLHR